MKSPGVAISIVIPCFNDAELLDRCLTSLRNQSVAAHEIIVVDNGSTDDSAQVARRHGARVISEPRRGITWATQAGFNAATGELIARTDADIVAPPTYVASLQRAWQEAQESCADGGNRIVGLTGSARFELKPPWDKILSALYLGAYRAAAQTTLGHVPFYGTNCALSTQWWKEVRDSVDFSDVEVHDDLHLSFALRAWETIVVADHITVDMDPRALIGLEQLRTRFRRGFHTVFLNWHNASPWDRWKARRISK